MNIQNCIQFALCLILVFITGCTKDLVNPVEAGAIYLGLEDGESPGFFPRKQLSEVEYQRQESPETYLDYIESDDYYRINYLLMTNAYRVYIRKRDKELIHATRIYTHLAGKVPPSIYSLRAKRKLAEIEKCKKELKETGKHSCRI